MFFKNLFADGFPSAQKLTWLLFFSELFFSPHSCCIMAEPPPPPPAPFVRRRRDKTIEKEKKKDKTKERGEEPGGSMKRGADGGRDWETGSGACQTINVMVWARSLWWHKGRVDIFSMVLQMCTHARAQLPDRLQFIIPGLNSTLWSAHTITSWSCPMVKVFSQFVCFMVLKLTLVFYFIWDIYMKTVIGNFSISISIPNVW